MHKSIKHLVKKVFLCFSYIHVTLFNVSCMKVYFPNNTSLFFFPSNLIIVHLGPEYAWAYTHNYSVLPVLIQTPPSCPFGLAKSVSHTATLFIKPLFLLSSLSVCDHHKLTDNHIFLEKKWLKTIFLNLKKIIWGIVSDFDSSSLRFQKKGQL